MSPTLLLDFEARYCFEPELFWEAAQDTEPTERLTLADVPFGMSWYPRQRGAAPGWASTACTFHRRPSSACYGYTRLCKP
mmetsp:Transcript_57982/g.126754  ORF Transcript_57982/g.126754 Transcript_57982/m.126754 type:complete len:80 (-) Transcript_57982:16-255(-)